MLLLGYLPVPDRNKSTELCERVVCPWFLGRAVSNKPTLITAIAGGYEKAVSDMKNHFRRKFEAGDNHPQAPLALYLSLTGTVPECALFTDQEVATVVYGMRAGKSTGPDGLTYELLQVAMGSDLRPHLVEFFNDVLLGTKQLPKTWLLSQVVLLPKHRAPAQPRDLRPIVLSSSVSKVFTRLLLHRLRERFPPLLGGQIIGEAGAQTLDAALAVQHTMRLANERKQPLVVAQLDVAEAFDTISHTAVARYLASLGPCREAHLLLLLVTQAKVTLQLSGSQWTQPLRRGIVQGAPYSAELYARVVDYHLAATHMKWQAPEETWLFAMVSALFLIAYADDMILLACSCSQMTRMIMDVNAVLTSMGLQLSLAKCKYMQSAYVEDDAVCVGGLELKHANTLVFLGILMGFAVTCVDVLNHRLGIAAKTFHGFYRILCRGTTPVKKRLQLLDSYITSKWRWMSPAVRPVTKVKRLLEILHLTYVCSIARLAYDPLTSASNNWVARRRASRMLAHLVGHTSWSVVQTRQFFSYWGHAARLPLAGRRPVRLAIEIFGLEWTSRHEGIVRRQRGYWPNTVRFLQLAWEKVKSEGEPLFWTDLAQQRAAWTDGERNKVGLAQGCVTTSTPRTC